MLCQDIMKRDVECLSPDDHAVAAARKMRDHNVGFLPICDKTAKVLGTITDRDLAVRLVADNRSATTAVKDLMSPGVIACDAKDDIRKAEELMGKSQKSRIMCLEDAGRLVGVISLSDIAQHEKGSRAARTMKQVTEREAHA
jgi:CBS domain-containing protein